MHILSCYTDMFMQCKFLTFDGLDKSYWSSQTKKNGH